MQDTIIFSLPGQMYSTGISLGKSLNGWSYTISWTQGDHFFKIICPGSDQSKKISNQIPHPALKSKGEITKYINWQQITKGTHGKPNEQLFPGQVVIQLPKIY